MSNDNNFEDLLLFSQEKPREDLCNLFAGQHHIYLICNKVVAVFFKKKTGNGKNGKSKKTGKREKKAGKREIFKNNFYINFIYGLANQSIFIVY
jgi:hypothetical protein